MTNRLFVVPAFAALLTMGCYSGVDVQPGGLGLAEGGQGDGEPPEPTGSEPEPDAPADDEPDPSDDEPEPAEDPFEVPNHEVRLLPFGVRMNNLARLLDVEQDHFVFDELYMRRTMLGDHDYANGVAPDLSWSPTKMSVWVKGLVPVCNSAQWLARYPNLSADPAPLLRDVLARDPDADELAAYQSLATNAERPDELTCLAALSSLDFVAR